MHNLDRAKFLLVRNADDSLFAPLHEVHVGRAGDQSGIVDGAHANPPVYRDFFLSPEAVLLLGLTDPLVDD